MSLSIEPAFRLAARPAQHHWLIENLWAEEAVGIVGGEPKCFKSFLSLDMAVAVASGTPCLGRFGVPRPGRVLLYPAEDALHVVRQRLDGLCQSRGVALESLDVQVITTPSVRLDQAKDREHLAQAVDDLKPRLLVLDPFVRLHRVDENASGDVAPMLAFLRQLQRNHGVAVVVVHHARKGGAMLRAGQALRGSSEFHAWGDSNLYLRRHKDQLTLTAEHRAAATPPPLDLALKADDAALALHPVEGTTAPHADAPPGLHDRIAAALRSAGTPLSFEALRTACRVRTASLCQALAQLAAAGHVLKSGTTYALPTT
jgi:hypothetical protein